jgi:hypothetical protein
MAGAALLTRYGDATRAEYQRYLTREAPAPYLDPLLAEYPARGGKMLRPAICIANARVFGGDIAEGGALRCGDRTAPQRTADPRRYPGRQRTAARPPDSPCDARCSAGNQRWRRAVVHRLPARCSTR